MGRISPRSDLTAVTPSRGTELESAGLMEAEAKRNEALPRGSELTIAIYWLRGREGSNVQKVSQRIAVLPKSCAYSVPSHAHVSVRSRKVDSIKIMWTVVVSAFSGPGNEGTMMTTRV